MLPTKYTRKLDVSLPVIGSPGKKLQENKQMILHERSILVMLLIFSLFGLGCNEAQKNETDISIKGCVVDSLSNLPIPNAKVTLLCWYYAGWNKTDYVSIDTVTDKNGCFAATLEMGYKAIVASVAPYYYPNLKSSDNVQSKPLEMDLYLTRRASRGDTGLYEKGNIKLQYYIVANSDK